MIVLVLLLLLLTPAWSLAQDAEEPSLAEIARRERERRAGLEQPAQIITNANLKNIQGFLLHCVFICCNREEK